MLDWISHDTSDVFTTLIVPSMSESVKKPYNSALRAAQARATRRTVVEAAAQLFIERGYGATTVDAIATAAGVSRKTVFTSVGGKAEALKLAIDWAIVGDDEPVPVVERPHVAAALEEPDARRILADYVRSECDVNARIAPLNAVLHGAAGLDADIRALAEDGRAQRLRGMQFLVQVLADRGALRPDLTTSEAADILWLFNPDIYHRLVIEQRWSPDRYEQWLTAALDSLLISPGYRPKASRPRRSR